MAQFGFCGPTYTSQSPVADAERCVNLYPEQLESSGGKSAYALYPTPGLKTYVDLGGPSIRGMVSPAIGIILAVSGVNFYSISGGGVATAKGIVVDNGLPVSMALSNSQLLICSGSFLYVYNWTTGGPFVPLPPGTATPNNAFVDYCDGFFIAMCAVSDPSLAVSALFDATTWPGTQTASVSVFPTRPQRILVNQRQLFVWSLTACQPYYNSGNIFPFDVVQGAFVEQGISDPNSAVKLDNSIFWIGSDARGNRIAWRMSGYTPQRVSNHAVEYAWQAYPQDGLAIAYSYQDQGHSFWVIYFPTANPTGGGGADGATWVYDVATGMWHERTFLNPLTGHLQAHRSRCHVFDGRQHFVGDWQSGKIFTMAIPSSNGSGGWNYADDFGNNIQRKRVTPVINLEKQWMLHHSLELDMETGLGPIPPLSSPQEQDYSANFAVPNQNPIGSPWTQLGSIALPQLINNGVSPTTNATITEIAIYNTSWSTDQFSEGVLRSLVKGSGYAALVLRGIDQNNFYYCGLDASPGFGGIGFTTPAHIWKLSGGVLTILTSVFCTPQVGDIFKAIVQGTTISFAQNGTVITSVVDATLASGSAGLFVETVPGTVNATDISWSSWNGGNLNQVLPRSPQIMMRFSNDGAHTWSNQRIVDAGQAGEYNKRVVFRRLGRARQRNYEITCTDPVPWRFISAYVDADPAYKTEERLIRKALKGA